MRGTWQMGHTIQFDGSRHTQLYLLGMRGAYIVEKVSNFPIPSRDVTN
jgi:hypothetical protein